jgi:hypothetical protein
MPIVSLAEVKTYLGITGTVDDQLISTCIVGAVSAMELATGRTFSYSSNVTRTYSTNGEASIVIHDVPAYASNYRTVSVNGVSQSEGTGAWFLPDRRNPEVSVTLQLRYYDTSRGDWYKANPNWWDANMDSGRFPYGQGGTPNDLIYNGPEGHANPTSDVVSMAKAKAAQLYWQAKSGASGTVQTLNGETIDLSADPIGWAQFVKDWQIKTWVAGV